MNRTRTLEIEYSGLRPGEKLFEELLANMERTLPTYNPKVKVAEVSWLDHEKVLSDIHSFFVEFSNMEDYEIVKRIMSIVPEYLPANSKYSDKLASEQEGESVEVEVYPD